MGFLPVSQCLHISVSALPDREIKTRETVAAILFQCVLKAAVTLLMALLKK